MKVKNKETGVLGWSDKFNIHGMDEIIVGFEDGDMSSEYIRDYEVLLGENTDHARWVDLSKAFKNHDVITNNFNTHFFEPSTQEERERGYAY